MTDSPEGQSDVSLEKVFYHRETTRLVHWREFSGARTAVLLTLLVTVLTFITGLSTLSQEKLVLEGPLAAVLPDVTGVVRLGGVLFAFLLGLLVFGLHRGKRLAWYLTIAVLPVVGLLPLLTLQTTHMPLLLLILGALPVLVINRAQFDQRIDLSSLQVAALSSIVGVLVYGTTGSYVLRDQFTAIDTWTDAIYYVFVTIATVGYGDITPLTPETKWFSLSIILLGTGAFTAAIGSFIVPAIEKRMATAFGNMTPSGLNILEDHVLVLGYSDITESLLGELAGERDIVVVTADKDDAANLDDRDVSVLTADPTDEDRLRDAKIETASGVVVATRDDAQDVLAVLAAKRTNPDVYIVAAANDQHNTAKLEDVGADEVISPMAIGGRILGRVEADCPPPTAVTLVVPRHRTAPGDAHTKK
ncbi:potassium channel protein [Halobacteriales archaeon QH_2_65_14]|nr:MAG: potassium channel protein [Halobacteriales archaeon QH_2_65_14]